MKENLERFRWFVLIWLHKLRFIALTWGEVENLRSQQAAAELSIS
jgi:hypothetical protein